MRTLTTLPWKKTSLRLTWSHLLLKRGLPIVIIVDIHGHTFTLYLPHERSSEAVRHAEEWGDTHGTVDWLLAQVDSKLTACCGLVTVPGSATLHVHPALTSGDLPSPDVALARDLS